MPGLGSLIAVVVMILAIASLFRLTVVIANRNETRRSQALIAYFSGTVIGGSFKFTLRDHVCYLRSQRFGCSLEIELPAVISKLQIFSDPIQKNLSTKVGRCTAKTSIGNKGLQFYSESSEGMTALTNHPKFATLVSLLFAESGLKGVYLTAGTRRSLFDPRPQIYYLHQSLMLYQHPQLLEAVVLDLLEVFEPV